MFLFSSSRASTFAVTTKIACVERICKLLKFWQTAILLSVFLYASALVPCKNGGELSEDGGTCTCFDGFTGPDCNELVDYCRHEDDYNSKCAPNSCVPINNAFYCTRYANDTTATANEPYFVFLPKVRLFEQLPVLFSLADLGDDLTLKVVWGDGVEDIRQGKDFHRGFLRDEVPSIGLDALAPGTAAFQAMPRDRRYIVRFKHSFNRWLSSKGPVKNWFILINQPANELGKEMQHQFELKVVLPAADTAHAQDHGVDLSMPELGGVFASDNLMPHWSRRVPIQVLGEAQDSVTKGSADEYTFTHSLVTRIGTAAEVSRPHVVSPDKRFYAAPFTVPIGKHGLKYCAWNGTRLVDFIMGYFLVVPSPLQVAVRGGSARTVSPRVPLLLDASASVDLNEKDLAEVSFTWVCEPEEPAESCPFSRATGPRWTVPVLALRSGQRFTVVLTAEREFLAALEVRQSVTVDDAMPVNVEVMY
ncbi:Polycystic kidney disease 1-related protein [Frankliniella fusca]|uniref:Polycystic kidney disease 1-related protein n=1 Tax=Frankliniella fusca TaxID=407009 RepID=A0AAE1GRV6_9NEOP|nr:Polycystic kidney disease 1-related protein [Frankliniella fusca]